MKNKSLIRAIVIATFCCIIAYLAFSLQPRDGWRVKRGSTQYILDGKPVTGWQIIDDQRYYFDTDGRMYTGTWDIAGKCYRFGDDGVMYTGWLEKDGLQYYFDANGAMVTGWLDEGGW